MVGGVLASITALLFGLSGIGVVVVGAAIALIAIVTMLVLTFSAVSRNQATLEARFPAPATTESPGEKVSLSE